MLRSKPSGHGIAALACAMLLCATPATAQDRTACTRDDIADPPARQVFTCGDALRFEREPNAALRILQRPDTPAPRRIEVEGGAILIDVSPGSAPTQIRTPHAIATVRGTTYVVDAGTAQTSIFVLEGAVSVRRTGGIARVTLTEGQGVDVAPNLPLEVRNWGAGRISALLARFGR